MVPHNPLSPVSTAACIQLAAAVPNFAIQEYPLGEDSVPKNRIVKSTLTLKDGYLTVSAQKGLDKDEEDKKGRVLRQERYAGACSRSFYVGDVKAEDVKAKYENGVLKLFVPKAEVKQVPAQTAIAIE